MSDQMIRLSKKPGFETVTENRPRWCRFHTGVYMTTSNSLNEHFVL